MRAVFVCVCVFVLFFSFQNICIHLCFIFNMNVYYFLNVSRLISETPIILWSKYLHSNVFNLQKYYIACGHWVSTFLHWKSRNCFVFKYRSFCNYTGLSPLYLIFILRRNLLNGHWSTEWFCMKRTLRIIYQPPVLGRVSTHRIKLPSAPSNLVWNVSRDGGIYLDSLCQYLTTRVKNVLLTFNVNLPSFNLK